MTTEEKKLCENCAPKPRTSISVTDIYHPHCAHCGRCLDGRCVQLKHDGTVLTPPETGMEWEVLLDKLWRCLYRNGYGDTALLKAEERERNVRILSKEIANQISSALAQGEKIGAEKIANKVLLHLIQIWEDDQEKEFTLHQAIEFVEKELDALKG